MDTAEEGNLTYTSNLSIESVSNVYGALEYHFGWAENCDYNLAGKPQFITTSSFATQLVMIVQYIVLRNRLQL